MKYIFSILLCLILQTGFSQIIKTVGVSYTNGIPTYIPAKAGSWLALDTVTWKYYTYNGSTWLSDGFRVQTISGCSAPAYTPTKFQSLFVINACTVMQGGPELYFWNGSAWIQINEGQTYTAGTGIDITGDVISATGTKTVFEVEDSTAFRAFSETAANSIILTDVNRGGLFAQCVSCTADQYMVFTDALSRKWERIAYQSINPKWFGALGNNAHNDGPAIQRAVNAASATRKGAVVFDKGTYLVSTIQSEPSGVMNSSGVVVPSVSNFGIKIISGVSLIGTTRDSTIIVNNTGSAFSMFRVIRAKDISFSGIGVNMNLHLGSVGMSIDSSSNVDVDNCYIYNTGWAVYPKISNKIKVQNNILAHKRISNSPGGNVVEFQGCRDIVVNNNLIYADYAQVAASPGIAPQGIEIWTTFNDVNNVNITVTNNVIKYTKTGIGCQACVNSTIVNNTIDSVQQNAITFVDSEQGLNVTPSNTVLVQGNTITRFGIDATNGGNGVYLGTLNTDIKIFFNTISRSFSGANLQGHGIAANSATSRNIQIKNNLLQLLHGSGMSLAVGEVYDISQNTIIDFSIVAGRDGIEINAIDSSVISNNFIYETRVPKTGQFGIYIQASATNCFVFNNRCHSGSWGTYSASRGTNVFWGNNGQFWTLTMDMADILKAGTRLGAGSTSDRDGTPLEGTVRGNTTTSQFEGYLNGSWQSLSTLPSWNLAGNAASGADFLGTTNDISLITKTNNIRRMIVSNSGKVQIGGSSTPSTQFVLRGTNVTGGAGGMSFTSDAGTSYLSGILAFNRDAETGGIYNSGMNAFQWVNAKGLIYGSDTITGLALQTVDNAGSSVNNNLFVATTNRIGINKAQPTATFHIKGTVKMEALTAKGVSHTNILYINPTTKEIAEGPGVAFNGNHTTTGTATTAFTVTLPTTQPDATYSVSIMPKNALSATGWYISARTTTTFEVTYLTGLTGAVDFDYIIVN